MNFHRHPDRLKNLIARAEASAPETAKQPARVTKVRMPVQAVAFVSDLKADSFLSTVNFRREDSRTDLQLTTQSLMSLHLTIDSTTAIR